MSSASLNHCSEDINMFKLVFQETMGIYGRVCGPATTTVQLFEEETCMMDDNATPAK